jgi:phage tail-like protein
MADVLYPIPKFRFKVSWDKQKPTQEESIGFTEVSGLDYSVDPIEYRDGLDSTLSKRKMAGMRKFGNVTLKRGVFKGVKDFYAWIHEGDQSIAKRKDYRRTITITLLDEEGTEVVTWNLRNAFPLKVQFDNMKADANEVSVETLELAHEGVEVKYL